MPGARVSSRARTAEVTRAGKNRPNERVAGIIAMPALPARAGVARANPGRQQPHQPLQHERARPGRAAVRLRCTPSAGGAAGPAGRRRVAESAAAKSYNGHSSSPCWPTPHPRRAHPRAQARRQKSTHLLCALRPGRRHLGFRRQPPGQYPAGWGLVGGFRVRCGRAARCRGRRGSLARR